MAEEEPKKTPRKRKPKAEVNAALDAMAERFDLGDVPVVEVLPPEGESSPVADGEDHFPTILELVREIPRPGFSWFLRVNGIETEIKPGEWNFTYVDPDTFLPLNCPVQPIGKTPEGNWFRDPRGGVIMLGKNAGKGEIDHLFSPMNDYPFWAWPQKKPIKDDNGQVVGWDVDNYKAELVRKDLFRAAGLKGDFDPLKKFRGRGCWRDRDGGLIFHAGDRVLYKNTWHLPGEIEGHIYTAKEAIGRPSNNPSTVGPDQDMSWSAQAILSVLKTWKWTDPEIEPLLLLGFVVSARLSGVLKARPPAWITGAEGSGKTELFKLVTELLCDNVVSLEAASAAGIYQTMRDDVLAVMLDERENSEDRRAMKALMDLVLVSFSGGRLSKGSGDGVPANYMLRSSFLMAGIVQASMGSAMESRMNTFYVHPIEAEKATGAVYDLKTMQNASNDIFGRMIREWPRFERNFKMVREALAKKGHVGRGQDTYGTLITCAHMAMHDWDIADYPKAKSVMTVEWWVDRLPEVHIEKSWQKLYSHIMDTPVQEWKHSTIVSIGAVISDATSEQPQSEELAGEAHPDVAANKKLRRFGLFIERAIDHSTGLAFWQLFIPNTHPGLGDFLKSTRWGGDSGETGAWRSVLKQIPPHIAWPAPKPVMKNQSKATRGVYVHLGEAAKSFE